MTKRIARYTAGMLCGLIELSLGYHHVSKLKWIAIRDGSWIDGYDLITDIPIIIENWKEVRNVK